MRGGGGFSPAGANAGAYFEQEILDVGHSVVGGVSIKRMQN